MGEKTVAVDSFEGKNLVLVDEGIAELPRMRTADGW
jgi:hypothetical protein